MSISVKSRHLTRDDQNTLADILLVEIKSGFVRKRNGKFDRNNISKSFLVRDCIRNKSGKVKIIRLPLYFGTRFCTKEKVKYIGYEHDEDYTGYELKGKCRDYQESIIDETFAHVKKHKTALIAAFPSAGKTFMAAVIGSMVEPVKIAIIIARKTLAKSWIKTFRDNTDAKVNYYKCPRSEYLKMDLPWEFNVDIKEANVSIIMVERIKTISEEIKKSFGMIVVDEAHQFYTERRAQYLLQLTPKYLLFLTATPTTKNGSDKVLKLFVGTHKVERKIEKHFKIYDVRTGIVPTVERDDNGNRKYSVLYQSCLYNPLVSKYIRHLLIINPTFKTLVLTSEKDHVEVVSDMLDECKIKHSTMYGTQDSYKDRKVLLGTVSKIGTGFDESNFATHFKGEKMDLLILLVSYKNRNMYEQTVGRVFRAENPRVVFLHHDDPTFDNHSNQFRLWTKSQHDGEFIPEQVELSELEQEMDKVAEKFATRNRKKKRIIIDSPEPKLF